MFFPLEHEFSNQRRNEQNLVFYLLSRKLIMKATCIYSFKLKVTCTYSENMKLEKNYYDVIAHSNFVSFKTAKQQRKIHKSRCNNCSGKFDYLWFKKLNVYLLWWNMTWNFTFDFIEITPFTLNNQQRQ